MLGGRIGSRVAHYLPKVAPMAIVMVWCVGGSVVWSYLDSKFNLGKHWFLIAGAVIGVIGIKILDLFDDLRDEFK